MLLTIAVYILSLMRKIQVKELVRMSPKAKTKKTMKEAVIKHKGRLSGKKGQQRTKGSGRKRGSMNRSHIAVFEMADKLGVNPLEIMFQFAAGTIPQEHHPFLYIMRDLDFQVSQKDKRHRRPTEEQWNKLMKWAEKHLGNDVVENTLRFKAASEIAHYMFPKRQSIQHEGTGAGVAAGVLVVPGLLGPGDWETAAREQQRLMLKKAEEKQLDS